MHFQNGGIYVCKGIEDSSSLVVVFTMMADRDSTIVTPLCDTGSNTDVPVFISDKLMYVKYLNILRVKKADLISHIGFIGDTAIDIIAKNIALSLKHEKVDRLMSSAIMLPFNEKTPVVQQGKPCKIVETPVPEAKKETTKDNKKRVKTKYTLDDYLFIKNNYRSNMAEVISKYNLKDRQAVYRVNFALQKRFAVKPQQHEEKKETPTAAMVLDDKPVRGEH